MLGDRLKELRKNKNISQKDICEYLDIQQNTYSGYENNKHIPDLNILIKIADYYKVSLDYLTDRYNKT